MTAMIFENKMGSQPEFPFFPSDWIRKVSFVNFASPLMLPLTILTMFEVHFCFDKNIFLIALLRSEFSPDLHLTQLM